MKLEQRISQRIGNVEGRLSKRGPESAQNDLLWSAPGNNQPTDHDIIASLNKGAGGDVTQRMG